MQLILYYAPIACSLAPYVTLTEAGADFEVRPLNFGRRQQMSAEYMKLNPKHKVPVLVVDGEPLTETWRYRYGSPATSRRHACFRPIPGGN